MFKVPFYRFQNYHDIMGKPYEEQNTEERVEFGEFLKLLTPTFVQQYAQVDARTIGDYINQHDLLQPIDFNGEQIMLEEFLIAAKLLLPTMWSSDYFLWNAGEGSHSGIDIMLPKGTPILSFSEGKVVRVKKRDGEKNDEGNCVVIHSGDFYYSYKHLDSIGVEHGQDIVPSAEIGTCGST